MHLDFQTGVFGRTGVFGGQPPQMRRTLGELRQIFADAGEIADEHALVYEVHGSPPEVEGPARLLYATTVLQAGRIADEYFMTRGHFHTNTERGELVFTLRGQGALILMDRAGETWMEPMREGSVHDIDGRHAHRVANTGLAPLIFLVAWMSDCGHDYESIRARGFSKILVHGPTGPMLVERGG
jgi:glucose-6-phosphate isomerase